MYTIKHAAELTGVPAATLRAWERRYTLVAPERTEAGYRLYDEESLGRIRDMATLLADGWSASTAAAEVNRQRDVAETVAPPPSPAGRRPDVDAHREPTAEGCSATTRLIDAAASMVPAGVARVLDERFALTSFESVVDDWLMPALEEVGLAWADGRIHVAGEHLVAHAVLRRLAAAYDAAASRSDGPTVIVGLPAGVHHELGIFAFAVALRRRGLNTVYLGPDLPAPAWSATLTIHAARCAVLSAPSPEDVPAARELVETLCSSHREVSIVVGGGQQDAVDDPRVERLGHAIGPAAAEVAALLS